MTLTVRSATGETVQLAEQAFAQGGEAAVHTVAAYPSVVVKLYHPEILQKRNSTLRAKIDVMTSDPLFAAFKQHPNLAWPRFSVFDTSGTWRGYAMRKAEGTRMVIMAHAMAYREHFPGLDRAELVAYLLNLLSTIRDLHTAGVIVGDYNLTNFLCCTSTPSVTLIDCDSWQVSSAGKTFRCPVAAPDMLPPELLGKELGKITRTPEHEQFSLAIMLFKLFLLGRHPYDACGGNNPVENIRNGYFPYGLGAGGIPRGPWYNIWSHLPYKLKEQLVRTFKEGAQQPDQRTSITEWISLLQLYQRELEKGWHNLEIRPATPKDKTHRGAQ